LTYCCFSIIDPKIIRELRGAAKDKKAILVLVVADTQRVTQGAWNEAAATARPVIICDLNGVVAALKGAAQGEAEVEEKVVEREVLEEEVVVVEGEGEYEEVKVQRTRLVLETTVTRYRRRK